MPLGAVLAGWAATTLWFLAARWLGLRWARDRGVTGHPPGGGSGLRFPGVYIVEACLVTLLAALWFASLGRGSWVLLFILLGATTEWSALSRLPAGEPGGHPRTIRLLAGIGRMVVAGGILRWIL